MTCLKTGRLYRIKKDAYHIYIRRNSLLRFYQKANFTIIRERKRLEEHLRNRGLLTW
ncbi:MAG: hypothetical protein QXU28_06110 [Nitrososphaerota archaeon]